MNNKLKTISTNTLIIGMGAIVSKGAAFIIAFVLANFLSTKQYGSLDVILTYVSLALPFITMELSQAMYRKILENPENANEYYLKSIMSILLNVIIFIVILIFINTQYKFYIFIYTLLQIIFNFTIEYVRGLQNLKLYSICNIINSFTFLVLAPLFLKCFQHNIKYVLLAYSISFLICIGIVYYKYDIFRITNKGDYNLKKTLSYSLPLIPNGISWWVTNASDRLIINLFLGVKYNGLYAMAYKIPTLLTSFFSVFNLSFQQMAFLENEESDIIFYDKLFNELFRILSCVGLLIIMFVPIVYGVFLPHDYIASMKYIPSLLSGTIFLCLSQYLGNMLLSNRKNKIVGISTTISAIFNILINLLLIKQIGLFAASFSTMISYIILYTIRYFNQRKSIVKKTFYFKTLIIQLLFLMFSYFYIRYFDFNIVYMIINVFLIIFVLMINKNFILSLVNICFKEKK